MGDNGIVVVGDDMGDSMQCADHPYRSNQGGICAYCLQERLGKLVSSKSNPFFPLPISPSPSSPPELDGPPPLVTTKIASTVAAGGTLSFLSKKKIKNSSSKKVNTMASSSSTSSSSSSVATGSYSSVLALKRSKSVAPRPLGGLPEIINTVADSPRKKSFWSFLYHPAPAAANGGGGGGGDAAKRRSTYTASGGAVADLKQQTVENHVAAAEVAEESPGGSQASSSFGRKVSRSRSVGCGSRSFSGDFLERISTGFGDCTLRRVESHREGKQKCAAADGGGLDDEQQRFKCGGLFGGFGMIITEASEEFENAGRRMSTSARLTAPHGRHRGWGWASLASPMRALKPTATGSTAPSTTIISTTAGSSSSNSTVNNSIDKLSCNSSMLEVGS